MRIARGKVVQGQIVVEGEPLSEGAIVTILSADAPTFTVSEEDEQALLAAISEADRHDLVDAGEVLSS